MVRWMQKLLYLGLGCSIIGFQEMKLLLEQLCSHLELEETSTFPEVYELQGGKYTPEKSEQIDTGQTVCSL